MFAYTTYIFHLFGLCRFRFVGSTRTFLCSDSVVFFNLAWFTGPMIASFILYTRLRSAAVTSAALLALALYVFLSYSLLLRDGVQDGSLIWVIYLIWGVACFVLSSLIAHFKPAIFICSAKSAFFSTLIINLLAVPLAIMIFKIM